jgi:hypothetical protein
MENNSDKPGLSEEDRDEIRQQEAKDVLRQSFEHGAPETGSGDDLDIETQEPAAEK